MKLFMLAVAVITLGSPVFAQASDQPYRAGDKEWATDVIPYWVGNTDSLAKLEELGYDAERFKQLSESQQEDVIDRVNAIDQWVRRSDNLKKLELSGVTAKEFKAMSLAKMRRVGMIAYWTAPAETRYLAQTGVTPEQLKTMDDTKVAEICQRANAIKLREYVEKQNTFKSFLSRMNPFN
jgi:hypothetical protein